jgi:hypothetical protein
MYQLTHVSLISVLIFSFLLGAVPEVNHLFGLGSTAIPVATNEKSIDLLQFTSAGHVLGFEADGIYAASGSHALQVEFVNAN